MGLLTRFQKYCETTEDHSDSQLKTHYYKANFNQLFDGLVHFFSSHPNCKIASMSKEHGEIAVECFDGIPSFIIITVSSVKPFETAVDFNLSTERFSLMGSYFLLKKQAISFYKEIDQMHSFIGSGKNAKTK